MFLGYLARQYTGANFTFHIRGVQIFDSNMTMWIVYDSTWSEADYSRLFEWGAYAQSYAFAIQAHETNNASGEIPMKMKVIETNTSTGSETTFNVSKGLARLFAYKDIDANTYFRTWSKTLNDTTESEQRRASKIDASFRNVTYYANGTWEYAEPPKSEQTGDNSSESETDENARLAPPPAAARSVG
jgi:hypothetical protein